MNSQPRQRGAGGNTSRIQAKVQFSLALKRRRLPIFTDFSYTNRETKTLLPCYYNTVSSRLSAGTAACMGTKSNKRVITRHTYYPGQPMDDGHQLSVEIIGGHPMFEVQRTLIGRPPNIGCPPIMSTDNWVSIVHRLSIEHSQPRCSLIPPIIVQRQHLKHYVRMHTFVNTRWRVYSSQWWLADLKVGRRGIIDTTIAPLNYLLCFLKAKCSSLFMSYLRCESFYKILRYGHLLTLYSIQ